MTTETQLTDEASLFWESFDPFTHKGVPQVGTGFIEKVPIDFIYVDPTINMRAVDGELVAEYAESMLAYAGESEAPGHWQDKWNAYPKIVQSGFLFSGFHTIAAAKQAFGKGFEIEVRVWRGTRHDAYLLATGENYEHGRRRTRAEVRESVKRWLLDEEGKTWANRHIAEMCKTSVTTVGRMEQQLLQDDSDYERPLRRRMMREGNEIWIDTERIGGKSEEELPLIDQDNRLTELMEQIDKLHADLHIWYSEGKDLTRDVTHMAARQLRDIYAELEGEWSHRDTTPLTLPETHLEMLERIVKERDTAEELQESVTNIFYHRKVIQEWFDVGHWQKHSTLALYCREYAADGNIVEHKRVNELFAQLVADQHQFPVELMTCDDDEFLNKRDLADLQSDEALLSKIPEILKTKGLEVPTQPPSDRIGSAVVNPPKQAASPPADNDLDEDETPYTPPAPKSPPAPTDDALDDDDVAAGTPTEHIWRSLEYHLDCAGASINNCRDSVKNNQSIATTVAADNIKYQLEQGLRVANRLQEIVRGKQSTIEEDNSQ